MYVLIDIGGTKTRIARSDRLDRFENSIIFPTPQRYDDALRLITERARKLAGGEAIEAMSIGVPAALDHKRSIITAPHLPLWNGYHLANDVEDALSTRVVLENDTALVGLGEAVFGAGSGAPIVAYLTVSTGVNGVRIVDTAIDRASRGFEIGGQYVSMDPPVTLEDIVSGAAVKERYGKEPRDLGAQWPVWEDLARVLAFGLHSTILHWSPDKVVLGGSMLNPIGISVERVKAHLTEIIRKFPDVPPVVHSSLGDLGGLYGGMALLKR